MRKTARRLAALEHHEQMMFRLSRAQLLGSFLLLAAVLCLLLYRYLRILWWTP